MLSANCCAASPAIGTAKAAKLSGGTTRTLRLERLYNSNTRMALRKLRGGKTGTETPFDLKVVDLGEGETTCVIDWKGRQDVDTGLYRGQGPVAQVLARLPDGNDNRAGGTR
jgi:hypothetical protein